MSEKNKSAGPVQIGDWILVTELNLLRRAGHDVRLEPRHADLLAFMSAHCGEVVSTDDIIENVWNGQVVTDHSVYQAIAKLRKAVGDSASQPRYIETVPKRGYRLIAEVSEIPAEDQQGVAAGSTAEPDPLQPESEPSPIRTGMKRHWLFLAFPLVILLFGAWWFFLRSGGGIDPAYHAIAVLPFAALSERDTDRYIAEGFSIELANVLGRSERLRVIGPISAKLAATLGDSLPEIGRHLDADIMVHGSIRRMNDKLSVSGMLTEVETGHQLWSEVFDRAADDVLGVQREVANAVAGALQHTVEGGASAPQPHMQPHHTLVYDNYLLGRYHRIRRTQEDLEQALIYFGKALQLDPDYVPAVRGKAAAHLLLSFYGDEPLSEALENAQPFLERALNLAPDDAELQALIGLSHFLKGIPGLAEDFLMRAVATHPNLVEAWMWLGLAREQQGRLRDALVPLEHAADLEPLMVISVVNHANALSWLGRNDEAIALLTDLAATVNETFDNRAQLYRALSGVHLRQGTLVDGYTWADRALAVAPHSALSKANMALTLGLLGQFDQASAFARAAYEQSAPGRGVMEYLELGNIVSPGMLPVDLVESRLARLQRLPDVPEIEWRLANLDAGMYAYFEDNPRLAAARLRKALDGRDYPVVRADEDVFFCLSLADALRRSDALAEADDLLVRCENDLENTGKEGWDSLSLAVSRVRLAVLHDDQQAAQQLLEELFDRGFRDRPLMLSDPILKRLQQTNAYQRLLAKIVDAVDAAWKQISTAGSA